MRRSLLNSEKFVAYTFLLPALLFLAVFCLYPVFYNFIMGFQNMDMMNLRSGRYTFVGFDQYIALFLDPTGVFPRAVANTFTYTIFSIIFQFTLGFAFALLFAKRFPLSGFLRGLLMLAWLLPHTVTGLLGKYMFSTTGIINDALRALGLLSENVGWLVEKDSALTCAIITNIWVGIPYNMMLLTTGLLNIPGDVYESASIDGANGWQRFSRITLPMLKPTMLTVVVLGFINTFKVFDLIYVLTGGGPVQSSEVLASVAYRYSFTSGNFSKGAASANILFIILLLVSIYYLRFVKTDSEVM
ncbi:MAG: sugar ABC transporter permease [Eubacteriales bacterium]|nr:sugar ABC transporter permease [Eubacteriales bacterium]